MASKLMDERSMSPSSYFFQEIRCPAERQVGFWDRETMLNHPGLGMDGFTRTSGSKTIPSLPLEKLAPLGAESIECLGITQLGLVRDQNANLTHVVGAERATNLSMTPWKSVDNNLGTKSNIFGHSKSYFPESNNIDAGRQYESTLFSSSFSDMFGKKLKLASKDVLFGQSIDFVASHYDEGEPFDNLEEIEAQTIGDLLPDDDDLLSGMNGHLDYMARPNSSDDIDDLDIFSSGGGMELEGDGSINSSWIQRISKNTGGISTGEPGGLKNSIVGEHPCSENPSRTLFVRNIISNIEDSELRSLFEQYGDIRMLYTDCKHRGFVMISYYDIRAASNAIRALKNRPLRRRKLDIHFSIPKDVPSENDINQGTLMVFNPDPSVSNHDLHKIFSVYGEVKEIRERADKHHHKYIEFYDIRALEAAHRALNRMDVSQKSIKLEPNHFGGARLCSVEQSYLELEQEEFSPCLRQGSPPTNSPSIGLGPVSNGAVTSSCKDAQALHSSIGIPINQFMENGFQHSFSPSVPRRLTSSIIGGQCGRQSGLGEMSHSLGQTEFGFQHMSNCHPHSLPDYHDDLANGVPYNTPSALAADTNPRPAEGFDNVHIHPVGSNRHSIGPIDSAIGSGNGSCTLRGHHYMWSPSNSYRPPPPSYMMWMNPPSYVNGHPSPQLHRLPRAPSHMMNAVHLHRHQVGSAPAVNPSLWEKQLAYSGESHEISGFHPGSLGNTNFSGSPTHPSHNIFPHAGGNCMDPSVASTNVGLQSPQNRFHMVPRRNQVTHMPNPFDTSNERVRSRRIEVSSNQADNKKQYELDIDRILRREDIRTTLMIKNIPNKYTSKMLLAAIDEHHRGTYDFIYLPIDFKNKCNVGYAFINMIDPLQIVPFYQAFNGKKWEKFNSEKVATLAYARIQGKSALVAHFQNSSLMNEDKRCRPILFHTDGPNAGDQEPFPMGMNIRPRISKTRTNSSDENHQGSPSTSPNGEQSSTSIDSSSGSE